MSVASVLSNAANQITGAISQAARSTGISFEYLLTTARIESKLNPAAQASTSSASGLYQFIDQTWLGTLKHAGPTLGYAPYANAIVQGADGRYMVPDPAMRDAIMRLRDDPKVSAMMAGAFARSNAAQLASTIGRAPSEGELYIAHFLGSDGAAKLITAAARQPQTNAVQMFPQAAAANRGIFLDKFGRARTAGALYAELTGRYAMARTMSADPRLRGSIGPQATAALETVGTPQAAVAGVARTSARQDTRPLFQSMFTDRGAGPLTPVVQHLWSASSTPEAGGASAKAATGGQLNPLDLFTDQGTNARAIFGNGRT
ncbi:MAG TPA: transglycosylase SLT domain-containing protein [Pseudolabrys sp.]|nr:transglycosylase SLT domain-containing protein [Pseudolabrys sp.]